MMTSRSGCNPSVLKSTHADLPTVTALRDRIYSRELYDNQAGILKRVELLPEDNQAASSIPSDAATAVVRDQRRSEQDVIEHVYTLVRSALANPNNILIAISTLDALERIGHDGNAWAQLDERLVQSGTGHGARGVERHLQRVVEHSKNGSLGESCLELPVYRAPFRDGESVWIVAPRSDLPLDGELPPRICEVGTRKDIPPHSVYIRPGRDAFAEKMWLWLPEGMWREVKPSNRHPILLDRILKVYWTSPRTVKINWVLKTSSDSMRRRKRTKRLGTNE